MKTKHNLPFEAAPWEYMGSVDESFVRFRVGTCEGLWETTASSYDILAVINSVPGNGHFDDVLQWFENSCLRDKKDLRILEVWNKKLKQHLIQKLKFKPEGKDNVIKKYKSIKVCK